jgi:arylsulfatase A-like enzyme
VLAEPSRVPDWQVRPHQRHRQQLNGVSSQHTDICDLLRAAGYHTGVFGKWHMDKQRERPGFDEYASFVGQGQYFNCPLIVNGVDTPTVGWVDDVTTTYALNFIASSANQPQPFLMVLGFKTPHSLPLPPTPTSGLFSTITIDTPPNATSYPPYFVNPGPSKGKIDDRMDE